MDFKTTNNKAEIAALGVYLSYQCLQSIVKMRKVFCQVSSHKLNPSLVSMCGDFHHVYQSQQCEVLVVEVELVLTA